MQNVSGALHQAINIRAGCA